MNRNHVALFHAVAEAGSVTGAAERLHVSQPAVSKQIGELEGVLGLRLLDRLPRGVRLTDAGRLLAEYARNAKVFVADSAALGKIRRFTVRRLLPTAFAPESLPAK